jgi:hypothetical protein
MLSPTDSCSGAQHVMQKMEACMIAEEFTSSPFTDCTATATATANLTSNELNDAEANEGFLPLGSKQANCKRMAGAQNS